MLVKCHRYPLMHIQCSSLEIAGKPLFICTLSVSVLVFLSLPLCRILTNNQKCLFCANNNRKPFYI